MDPIAFDFETICFAPGMMAPPPVCASTYHPQDGTRIWVTDELPSLCERLGTERTPILWHGGAYDGCVWLEWMPEAARKGLWEKYERDEIKDSITTERIIEITTGVRGKLALDDLARRYGIEVRKSCVRTDFGRYYGQPLSSYSREHKRYVSGDAAELWSLYKRQRNRGLVSDSDLGDMVRSDLWLRLSSNYGIRTDPLRVAELERATQEDVDDLTEVVQAWGGMRGNILTGEGRPRDPSKWFSRDTKAIKRKLIEAYGERGLPRTDSWDPADPRANPEHEDYDPLWAISISKIALDESGDPALEAAAHLGELLAVRNKDVAMLQAGVKYPIHTRYGYAATTRTTSSKPNIQNPRRKRGIRECFVPRPGCCFVETDYPSLELFTLAQVCAWKLKRYDLVKHMNAGRDYHAVIAEGIFATSKDPKYRGMKYDQIMALKGSDPIVKAARDSGKYGNYGLAGGMRDPDTFALYVNLGSRTDENPRGIRWTRAEAAEVMAHWHRTATDPAAFLKYVDTLKNRLGLYDVELPGTNIVRRGCTRTAGANSHFQALGAKTARRAGWRIAKRQFITRDCPSRTVVFGHDAFLGECKRDDRDVVAAIQEEEMAAAMTEICPDMRIYPELVAKAQGLKNVQIIDSACADHYSKFAKSKRGLDGRLIVCEV